MGLFAPSGAASIFLNPSSHIDLISKGKLVWMPVLEPLCIWREA